MSASEAGRATVEIILVVLVAYAVAKVIAAGWTLYEAERDERAWKAAMQEPDTQEVFLHAPHYNRDVTYTDEHESEQFIG